MTYRASDHDLTAVESDEFGDDGKPETGTSATSGARLIGAIERLENPEEIFARDADAGILDHKSDMAA